MSNTIQDTINTETLVGEPVSVYFYGRIESGILSGGKDEYHVDMGHKYDTNLNGFSADEIVEVIKSVDGRYKVVLEEWIEWQNKKNS